MKLKNNLNKIITAFILIIVFSFVCQNNIMYAKTNKVYTTSAEAGVIDVDKAVSNAPVLQEIAHMIYALAGFVEEIVAGIVSVFTGQNVFPWADRVVFNTMPILDINFVSPSAGSLFADIYGNPTDLGNIVRNIYYIIFNLSVVFFGVVVGVMALKLAVASMASEKAKYKQAITNWLLALILIFTAHYLMSFIFFVNEKMVEVASAVITSQDFDFSLDVDNMTDEEINEVCNAIMLEVVDGHINYDQTYNTHSSLVFYNPVKWDDLSAQEYMIKVITELNEKSDGYYGKDIFTIKWGDYVDPEFGIRKCDDYKSWRDTKREDWAEPGDYQDEWLRCVMKLYADPSYRIGMDIGNEELTYVVFMDAAYIFNLLTYHGLAENKVTEEQFINGIRNLALHINNSIVFYEDSSDDQYDLYNGSNYNRNLKAKEKHFEKLWKHVQKYYMQDKGNYKEEVFSGMGDFFKGAVTAINLYKNKNGEYKVNDFNAVPAILYSIFIIQSIMYFIAYLKRFFFILVLALFAPLVIVYDFLAKTTSS